ncbi:remorin-like isoform X2 [Cucurbita pepo subsp. pepo]|uniref:remorin-like isoform X2 n=1 Tax=Cucurbita pepo subsp. pepo TaxID=3664 RepID=UPI000C9D6DB0|nr:remorin-like isoform X2 [Cucurbita pepo subsp. pepo]
MGGADESEPDSQPPVPLQNNSLIPHAVSAPHSDKLVPPKDRDVALARVELEKKLALIKAWEESEKIKAENRAYKRLSAIDSWENTKKASIQAQLMKLEKMEKKKAEYGELMKNKIVGIHKQGEEKKATIEAERREQCLKVEETAAKYRASGFTPKALLLKCFSG